ncbi:MAG: N-acetylmuramoyl-L-alanine amidase [Prevotella sp.]|nr:N-acetylmuramoyl-L-alanine amidase [Prevotella sp.]
MNKKILFTIIVMALSVVCSLAADRKFVLVIDAGHGGHDPGALGSVAKEKNINLSVALAFGKYVEKNCRDVKVVYTRTTDVFVPLQERAQIANRNKADLFISIHTNALEGGKISRGMETYTLGMHRAADNLNVAKRENSVILIEKNYKQTYAGFDPKSSESYILFELMQDKYMANSVELARLIQSETCSHAGRVNKGVHQAGFLVLRETSMPSCLVELGFITTPDEEAFLNSSEGQDKMAKGIFNAFVKYKNRYGVSDNTSPSQTNSESPAAPSHNNTAAKPTKSKSDKNSQTKEDALTAESHQTKVNQDDVSPLAGSDSPLVEDDTTLLTSVEYAEPQQVRSHIVVNNAPTARSESNNPVKSSNPQPTPQPTPEPAPKPTPDLVSQPVSQPIPQPAPQPAPQPTSQPTSQPTTHPTSQPTPQSTSQPSSQSTPQPAPPPTSQPTPQSTSQSTPQPAPQPTKAPVQSDPQPQEVIEVGGRPIFKVQIAATSQQIPVDAPQFLEVKGISCYTENDMFKYTVGASPDFDEISELKKELQVKFPQAFIIAFRDGIKINTGEAIREYKKNKQK